MVLNKNDPLHGPAEAGCICILICCFRYSTYPEAVAATVLFSQISCSFKSLYLLPQLSILGFQCFNFALKSFQYTFDDRFHQVGNLEFKRLLDLLSQSWLKRVLYDDCHFLQVRVLECYVSGAPRGFGDLGRMAILFSWSLGALVIILGEVGSKLIILGT